MTYLYLIALSYSIIFPDADKLAHVVYEPGSKALQEIVTEFGKEDILDSSDNSIIDRKKLGAIVFSDSNSMSVRIVVLTKYLFLPFLLIQLIILSYAETGTYRVATRPLKNRRAHRRNHE